VSVGWYFISWNVGNDGILSDEATDPPALQPSSQGKKSVRWELEEDKTEAEAIAIKRDWEDTSKMLAKCHHEISK
jgi:hypothetical protein